MIVAAPREASEREVKGSGILSVLNSHSIRPILSCFYPASFFSQHTNTSFHSVLPFSFLYSIITPPNILTRHSTNITSLSIELPSLPIETP